MSLKYRRSRKKLVSGRGYCACSKRAYITGKGIMDVVKNIVKPVAEFVKDNVSTLKSTAEAVGNVVKIGADTKIIVDQIMKNRKSKMQHDGKIPDIVKRINEFKVGGGFAYA